MKIYIDDREHIKRQEAIKKYFPDICVTQRLDVDVVAQNIVNYICATDIELKKLLAPVGNSTLPVGRSDARVCVDKNVADRLQIQYVC